MPVLPLCCLSHITYYQHAFARVCKTLTVLDAYFDYQCLSMTLEDKTLQIYSYDEELLTKQELSKPRKESDFCIGDFL